MSREIADSDDEEDFTTQPISQFVSLAEESNIVVAEEMADQDPLLDIDFQTYCSPTQHLSDFDIDNSAPEPSPVLDSSTNRFLAAVDPLSSSYENPTREEPVDTMGGKSSAATAGHKRTRSQADEGVSKAEDGRVKKAKTYGSSNTSNTTHHSDPYNNGIGISSSDMISVEPRTQYTSDTISLLSPPDASNNKAYADPNQLYNRPQGFVRGDSFRNMQGGIASRSSMGNYQSYTLDRAALDGNFNEINPFGQPSQLDEEDDALSKIFRPKAPSRQSTSQDAVDGIMQEMQTSPIKSNPTVAPEQLLAQPDLPAASPPFSPITNPDESTSLDTIAHEQPLGDVIEIRSAEDVAKPADMERGVSKKRGRKPKQKKTEASSMNEHNDVDELHLEDNLTRAIRAGTVDSVSNMSEVSQTTTTSKTGRKKKSKKVEPLPEELSKKLPSSDLGLDNKAVIGLSPERYVPRPSRRRGRAEPEPSLNNGAEKNALDDDPLPQQTPAKGKKGRKGRGKQKAVEPDEVESTEVIVVEDEETIEGNTADPEIKTQMNAPDDGAEANEAGEEPPGSANRRAKITVDVPVLPKADGKILPAAVPEPTKRGRKKKKQIEIKVDEPAAVDDEKEMDHPALAERDTNIQIKGPAGSKTMISEVEVKLKNEEEETKHGTSTRLATPSKEDCAATPNSKVLHSDFKPLSATPFFGTKGRVGLSKRFSVPSLLRKVDRNKEAPKAIERKEKLNKKQLEEREAERIAKEEAEAEGRDYVPLDQLRGKDGRLIEWDF